MMIHRINEFSAFSMVDGIADILNLLRALELPEYDAQTIENARKRLHVILNDEGSEEKRGLADVAYATLLALSELNPINDVDPITQENIHPDDVVYISTGIQLDIYQLIKYQHSRNYRGATLDELPDSKVLLNPTTNKPLSPRDSAHVQDVAAAKRIYLRGLKEGRDQEYTILARHSFFKYMTSKRVRPLEEDIEKACYYYQKYSRGTSQKDRIFIRENKNTVKGFIGFFEHPNFSQIGFPDYLTVHHIYQFAGFHYNVMDFFTPTLLRVLEGNVITPEQFFNNKNGELLLELIKPNCLEALESRVTCYDILKQLPAEELREANRANEYPSLMQGLLEVKEPILTQLIHNYSAVEALLKAGVTLEILKLANQPLRDMLLSDTFMVQEFSTIGISAAYLLEHDVYDIVTHIKIGTCLELGLLCDEINVQPNYLASLSPKELSDLAENYRVEEVWASIPRAQPVNFSP